MSSALVPVLAVAPDAMLKLQGELDAGRQRSLSIGALKYQWLARRPYMLGNFLFADRFIHQVLPAVPASRIVIGTIRVSSWGSGRLQWEVHDADGNPLYDIWRSNYHTDIQLDKRRVFPLFLPENTALHGTANATDCQALIKYWRIPTIDPDMANVPDAGQITLT